jgi:hypothetical protein
VSAPRSADWAIKHGTHITVVINAVSSEAATSRERNKFLNFIPLLWAACWADATTDAVVLMSNPAD